jgi:nitrogen regulatory protein PII
VAGAGRRAHVFLGGDDLTKRIFTRVALSKVRIELPLREEMVEPAIAAIKRARRRRAVSGFVLVTELHDAVLSKTGARGEQVIQ